MSDVFQFALLGLGAGAIYALLGQGLVLIYRGSGVLNLAHGAFAMAGAYVYYELHVKQEWAILPGIVASMLALAALGVLTDQLLLRRLRKASPLTRLIGTLGLLIVVQSIGVLRYGPQPTLVEPLFDAKPVEILGATVSADRLWLAGIAIAIALALWTLVRYTRGGWVMTAVSENPRSAAALGWSPELVSSATWALGAALAALAGILITPITQLSVGAISLTIIPALAAALIGGFVSFPLTLAGGLALGIAQSEVDRYIDLTGATVAVPLIAIAVVLMFRGSWLPPRGTISDRLPYVGSGRVRPLPTAVSVLAGLLAIGFGFDADWLSAAIVCFSVGTILLSLVVLTGYSGQLSLAQFALAGIGALAAARLVQAADFPFMLALPCGVLATVGVGLLVALPALRTRGVELAVITLGLGAAAEAMLFQNGDVTSSSAGTPVGSATLFGFDVNALDHPARYAILVFLVFVACALGVANMRRGRTGRRLLAVRTNERAAAALGINVFSAKLHAFAAAGALAGLGGVLLGFRSPTVVYEEFSPLASINAVADAVIGGVGFVVGPVLGATLAPDSFGQEIGGESANAANWLALIGGGALLLLLVIAPDGLANLGRRLLALTRRDSDSAAASVVELGEARPAMVAPRKLVVDELTVRYGGVTAVEGVSFTVAPGEVMGLIGPNGAGKTSVVDAVSGFARASGKVAVGDAEISGLSAYARARSGLARSFQGLELFEDMTVLENLQAASDSRDLRALATDVVRPAEEPLPPAAVAAVREFGLGEDLGKRPTSLSHGNRRLIAIARAVATNPSVLLLDEPAAGLDEAESRELATLVRRLADEWGIAVLVIEHDMEFVTSICDRVHVIDFGQTIAAGTPAEVAADPRALAAYLGEEPGAEPASPAPVGEGPA